MNRRAFIGMAGAGAGLVAVPLGLAATPAFEVAAAGILLRELDFLRHDRAGLTRFVDEYFSGADAVARLKIRLLYRLGRGANQSDTVTHMVSSYLMGSDFFASGMDESRTVTFSGLHDPYQGCSNPFAMIYYPRTLEPA